MESNRPSKRRRTGQYSSKVDKHEERREFEIIQRYRSLEDEVQHDKMQITRSGDVGIMSKRLEEIEHLFGDLQSLNVNKNAVLAQDSKAMKTISELLSLSMSSVKFDDSSRLIKLDDILNGSKKFMLNEFLASSGADQPGFDLNPRDDDDGSEEHGDHADSGEIGADGKELEAFKGRQRHSRYLSKFESFTEFNQFNWFKMGALYQNVSRMPFTTDHMLGPLYAEKVVRKTKERRHKDPIEKLSTAERVTKETLNVDQEESTTAQVKKCYKLLQKKQKDQKINLFRFVIDPSSFSKSVENLFYTSFLIKEGRLVLEDDSEGFPAVRIKEKLPDDPREKELEKQRRHETTQNHIIFQMDIPTWRKLIKRFDIKEAFLNSDKIEL